MFQLITLPFSYKDVWAVHWIWQCGKIQTVLCINTLTLMAKPWVVNLNSWRNPAMKWRAKLDECQLALVYIYITLRLHMIFIVLCSLLSCSIPWVHIQVHHWHQTQKKVTSWVWEKKVDQQGCGTDQNHSLQRRRGSMHRGLWFFLKLDF